MKKVKTSLVITSISAPSKILTDYADACKKEKIDFYLIGDLKSPADFTISGCNFYSIDAQKKLPFSIVEILPTAHYCRKNIGYLLAIQNKAEVILETDDDNIPLKNF